jgi:murein DD-endopeptidase MepM/ murein hydrolase activator NlpD
MRVIGLVLLLLMLAGCAHQAAINPATAGQGSATVQQGENFFDVARRLNVTVQDLAAVNHLQPPYMVKTGQVLVVPAIRVYTVVKGDSVSKIAQQFDVGTSRLAQLNHLSPPYKIFPGQQLQISGGVSEGTTAVAAVPAQGQAETETMAAVPKSTVEAVPLSDAKPVASGAAVSASPTALAPQTNTPTPAAASVPAPAGSAGKFSWPVRGQVISAFGTKPDGLQNDGINIAATAGTPVKATAAGVIAYAGNELKGFGNLVLIKHAGGWVSAYAHLDTINLKKGEAVKAGQVIGTVGQTGSVDSPQLHFELRQGKQAIDPATELQ